MSQGRFVLINRSNSIMPTTAFLSLAYRANADHRESGTSCALDQAQRSVVTQHWDENVTKNGMVFCLEHATEV